MEKLIIFNNKEEITSDDIYNLNLNFSDKNIIKHESQIYKLETLEIQAIINAMKKTNNVKSQAAKLLGISSYALLRRLDKYDLRL